MKPLFCKTERLVVRLLELKDFEAWREAHRKMDKSQNTWDLGPKPEHELTKATFRKLISRQTKLSKKDHHYRLAVFDKNGALVGGVSIMEVARGISQTAFLGYRIFNSYWRMGYGKEAVKAILDIGFDDIKLHRIEAGVEPKNIRSIRLAKSLGMRREGLKKRAIYLRNQWVDLLMFTVTCEDLDKKFDVSKLQKLMR
jgi:RimJ/RimL family protein N-acetyltransferase